MKSYILAIDQSTQGTKAILFDQNASLIARCDRSHHQHINDLGWVSHDLNEIYDNVLLAARDVFKVSGISPDEVACVAITNQRETSCAYDLDGLPLCDAVVWQCARAREITDHIEEADLIKAATGLNLSCYFPAAKYAWMIQNEPKVQQALKEGRLRLSTIDTYLLYRLTENQVYATDYSNASRTQLFNIQSLEWDREVCRIFDIDPAILPEVHDSSYAYGMTTFEELFKEPVPICSMIGDSQGALFGQRCISPGMVKATYGTGSSVMMNAGSDSVVSDPDLVTSLAWGIDQEVTYCLEGNINYSGAVISWLKNDLQLIENASESEKIARAANPNDGTFLIPAFSGLGAPYWQDTSNAMLVGMSRSTTRNEIVKAALESIGYQINDILTLMNRHQPVSGLSADGGPSNNGYLMQFQSDITGVPVMQASCEESSALGAALLAGMNIGFYDPELIARKDNKGIFYPQLDPESKQEKVRGWKNAMSYYLNGSRSA